MIRKYKPRAEILRAGRGQDQQRGFTLIEIAIVLVIIGLLLGGLLMPLATQVDVERRKQTEQTLTEIREALIGFAVSNGRLPCPADPTVADGTAGAGQQRPTCNTGTNNLGVIPWVDLGVAETDAWGHRFTYRVTAAFADAPPNAVCGTAAQNASVSFSLCDNGDNTVTDGAVSVATNLPAVIVSHGKNGYQAYMTNGSRISQPAAPTIWHASEQENANTNSTFVSRTYVPANETTQTTEYDDITTWVPLTILKNKMVAAGLLP